MAIGLLQQPLMLALIMWAFKSSASAEVDKTCNGPWVSCRIPCRQWYQYFDVKLNADLTVSITWLPNKASGTCAG